MAEDAGIIAWAKHEWNPKTGAFTHSDDGLDGDEACLMQFAAFVRAAEREACAKVCDALHYEVDAYGAQCAAAIRARGEK